MPAAKSSAAAPFAVFAACWMLLFLLYLPAAKAGWVSDTLGWLEAVRSQPFSAFVSRAGMGVTTFYQTTQVVTWALYQVLGANEWAWHLLHLSLQAMNATLLFLIIRRIFSDGNPERGAAAGWMATLLFCASPHISEVVVWEASFHFLQGLLFQLIVVLLMMRALHQVRKPEWVAALAIMLLAAGSLEVFYLTPVVMALVLAFYRFALQWEGRTIRRAALYFLLPQAGIAALHLLLSRIVFGTATARLGDAPLHQSMGAYAIKPPMLLFHLMGGRFLPQAARDAVYSAFCTYAGAGVFYAMLGMIAVFMFRCFRRNDRFASISGLAFFWMLFAIAFASPLWLPTRLLILGDRYLYIMLPAFYLLVTTLVVRLRMRVLRLVVAGCIIALQCAASLHLSFLWQRSDTLNRTLVRNFSEPDTNKITLLLNNPHSLCGAPMIGAGKGGELMLMRRLFYGDSVRAKVYEVAACDLDDEGAKPGFLLTKDDDLIVAFMPGGPRWWRSSDYLHDYTTPDYELHVDTSNTSRYILRLKGEKWRFRLMYTDAGEWHFVRGPARVLE